MGFWTVASTISPRKNEKARYPGRGVENYLHFHSEQDRLKYRGKSKIPMETFHEMYFDGAVDFKGDALEILEYRHDWVSFRFTLSLFRFFFTGMIPEVIMHTRSQGESSLPHPPSFSFLKEMVTENLRQTKSKSATTMTAAMTSTAGSLAPV